MKRQFFNKKDRFFTYLDLKRNTIFPLLTLIIFQAIFFSTRMWTSQLFSVDFHGWLLLQSTSLTVALFVGICFLTSVLENRTINYLQRGGFLEITYTSLYHGIYSLLIALIISTILILARHSVPLLINLELLSASIGLTYVILALRSIVKYIGCIYKDNIRSKVKNTNRDEATYSVQATLVLDIETNFSSPEDLTEGTVLFCIEQDLADAGGWDVNGSKVIELTYEKMER